MKIFIAILRCVVVVALVGYIGYFSVFCAQKVRSTVCNEVQVTVKDSAKYAFVSARNVDIYLNNNQLNPRGRMLSDINMEAMEQCLTAHSAIRLAKCYYAPSGRVCVDVWQREPMFRVMGAQIYFVDNERKRMPLFANNAVYVPIVSGAVDEENLMQICDFVEFLNADEFWSSQVEQIHISANDELELSTRMGDHQLLLGGFDDYEKRLRKMKRFYEKGIDVLDWNVYKKFDLRYKNQVIGVK